MSRYLATLGEVATLQTSLTEADLASSLNEQAAVVSYWRYSLILLDERTGEEQPAVLHYLAHVLLPDGKLTRVELGPAKAVNEAVQEWRVALLGPLGSATGRGATVVGPQGGATLDAGRRLRKRIIDPLVPHLGHARQLVVVPDDALHLVPWASLPDRDGVIGDRFEISVRTTLRELLAEQPEPDGAPSLLAIGGVDYDVVPPSPAVSAEQAAARGVSWRG